MNPVYDLYTVRHTVGTLLYQETKDIDYVARQLGDTIEIVMKHYVNNTIENFKQYSESLKI